MNSFKIGLIVLLCIFLSACNNNRKNPVQINNQLNYSFDSVHILTDSLTLDYYTKFHFKPEEGVLYCYNKTTNSIDRINLNNDSSQDHIKIPKGRGPNEINGKISGFFYHNKDSIFIYTNNYYLSIINSKSQVIKKYFIYDYIVSKIEYQIIVNDYFRLNYFPDTKTILFHNLYPNDLVKNHTKSSIVTSFNIETERLHLEPIYFSKDFVRKKGNVGFLRWLNFESYNQNKIFFNSQFNDELLIFDRTNKDIEYRPLHKHKKVPPLNDITNGEKWVTHAITNSHRFAILYDKWRNVFYRIVWIDVEYKVSEKFYNSMLDKPLIVEVYDSNFNLLNLIELEDYKYCINTWFVAKEGLYISPTHPMLERSSFNFIPFSIIKLDM